MAGERLRTLEPGELDGTLRTAAERSSRMIGAFIGGAKDRDWNDIAKVKRLLYDVQDVLDAALGPEEVRDDPR